MEEAAIVDGATWGERMRRVVLPNMKSAIMVALLFRTLDAFRIFDNIFINDVQQRCIKGEYVCLDLCFYIEDAKTYGASQFFWNELCESMEFRLVNPYFIKQLPRTSVPTPIATPTSTRIRAKASLIPSPTIATAPFSWSPATIRSKKKPRIDLKRKGS